MVEKKLEDKRGVEILYDPQLNKSTTFPKSEQEALGLVGLVQDIIDSEDLQLRRVMMQLGHHNTDLDKYFILQIY